MAIGRFFDKTVVIRRLRANGAKRTFQATATADGAIQSLDAQERNAQGFATQRAWRGWFDEETDINEGDQITRQDTGQVFKVVEVTLKDYGINQHLVVIFVEYNG